MNMTWNISDFGSEYTYIEEISSGQVLTLKYGSEENGTEVVLGPKNDPITRDQKWERKWFEEIYDKYTMLVHAGSGRFLTRDGIDRIIITGLSFSIKNDTNLSFALAYVVNILFGRSSLSKGTVPQVVLVNRGSQGCSTWVVPLWTNLTVI